MGLNQESRQRSLGNQVATLKGSEYDFRCIPTLDPTTFASRNQKNTPDSRTR